MEPIYDISDLCRLTGESPRTIHYYVRNGLLAAAGSAGRGPRYDDGHVARLRLVRRLQREHLPLGEIRVRLAGLTDEQAIELAGEGTGGTSGSEPDSARGRALTRAACHAPMRRSDDADDADADAADADADAADADDADAEADSAEPPGTSALDYVREVLAREGRAPSTEDLLRPRGRPTGTGSDARSPDTEQPAEESPGTSSPALSRRRIAEIPSQPAAAASNPFPRERSQWERITLAPDVELHIRRPQSRDVNRRIERLLDAARALFVEE